MGTTGQSVTLANSIIGVGILAMPFCYQQCGVLLATLILLFMGLVSRLCSYFLLKAALIARRRNFEFLAFHVFGPAGKFAVEVGIVGFLMGTCIAYFVVVGDLGPQIISKMFNINQSDILRTSIMIIVSLVCVLPLGLLRNVDSLGNVSAATIGFYFCLVMKVIAEAASQLIAGDWHTKVVMWKPSGLLQCVPIFSMALFCQTQLFEIFDSMPSLSLEKMCLVTKNAINICTGVYFTLGLFGYIAFCTQDISGNVLMSLSPTMANDVIKLGFVMSVACSFPLIIFPCRASLYSFLYKKVHTHQDNIINQSIPTTTFRYITVVIITVSLVVSLLIPNIELVLGLVGSTIGVLVCVVFPAACFVNVTFKHTNERLLAKATIILGLVILVLGTYANLQAAETQMDKYDERYITQERVDQMAADFFREKKLQEKLQDAAAHALAKEAPKNNAELKDSEAQPPNPMPPDAENSNGAQQNAKANLNISPTREKDVHPKDLRTKLNNDIGTREDIVKELEKPPKNDQIVETNKIKEKIQEHLDKIKEEKLKETIKKHEEEQIELMKEQSEILNKIQKTQEEMAVKEETKDVAVESIKKIADVAIQSINEKQDEISPIEKTANEAVQEIAKKAVESIVAIKEKINDEKSEKKTGAIIETVAQNGGNDDIVNKLVNENILPNLSKAKESKGDPTYIQNNLLNASVVENLYAKAQALKQNVPPAQLQDKKDESNINKDNEPKKHSHSNDEPQSYKQGEELQNNYNVNQVKDNSKVPLAVAMNALSQLNKIREEKDKTEEARKIIDNIQMIAPEVANVQKEAIPRHKREVFDCSTENILPKGKTICDYRKSDNFDNELKDVDLNEVLLKRLPHSGSRSLKSIEDYKKR